MYELLPLLIALLIALSVCSPLEVGGDNQEAGVRTLPLSIPLLIPLFVSLLIPLFVPLLIPPLFVCSPLKVGGDHQEAGVRTAVRPVHVQPRWIRCCPACPCFLQGKARISSCFLQGKDFGKGKDFNFFVTTTYFLLK